MKIEQITKANGRIHYGTLKCEICGHELYDQEMRRGDAYQELLLAMRCPKCKESTISREQKRRKKLEREAYQEEREQARFEAYGWDDGSSSNGN